MAAFSKTGFRFALLLMWLVLAMAWPMHARAQEAALLTQPYRLQVVLHVAGNRFLTSLFQEKVQRELRDQLQLSFGKLAQVEVVRTHPLLEAVEARGLQAALDEYQRPADAAQAATQAHFILLDHQAGIYTIQAGSHDGYTGIPSPLTRSAETADRGEVALLAARLVEEGFRPVGALEGEGTQGQLTLRGGKLAADWDKRVKAGAVFAVSRVSKEGDAQRARRMPWTLVEVLEAPKNGVCKARYAHRFVEDKLSGSGAYRCLLLPTVEAPLSLRFLDDGDFRPLPGVQVHILGADMSKREELSSQRDGVVTTRNRVPHLAIVRVMGGGALAQFPVEVLPGRTVTVRLRTKAEAEGLASLELRRDQWLRRLYDNLRLAGERSVELNGQLGQSLEAARGSAKAGLGGLEEEIAHLKQEAGELKTQAAALKPALSRFDLGEGEQRLADLHARRDELRAFVERLDKVLAETKGEKDLGLHAMLERARLAESEADYDQAIALYKRVTDAGGKQPKLEAHLQQLEKAWQPRTPRHAQARVFLYDVWPKLELGDLSKNLEKARESLAACQDAGDRLTPRRLVQANVVHTANLKKKLETLRQTDSEDNRNQAKQLSVVVEGLVRLHTDAAAFLAKREK